MYYINKVVKNILLINGIVCQMKKNKKNKAVNDICEAFSKHLNVCTMGIENVR